MTVSLQRGATRFCAKELDPSQRLWLQSMNGVLAAMMGSLAAASALSGGYLAAISNAGYQLQTTSADIFCQMDAVRVAAMRQIEEGEKLVLQPATEPCKVAAP